MSQTVIAKRRVEVCIGLPEMLEGMDVPKHKGMAHPDECFFINFVDLPDEDGEGQNGFTAQATCLCTLKEATTAWLNGATEKETKAMLSGGHDPSADHES